MDIHNLSMVNGQHSILAPLYLKLQTDEDRAAVGSNGIGKSTLAATSMGHGQGGLQ